MSTIKDIARAAGVSVSTVSHVVNKTKFVSEELTERVNKALLLCDTLPNFVQKKSSTTKDEIIVISSASSDHCLALYQKIVECSSENFHCSFHLADEQMKDIRSLIDSLILSKCHCIVAICIKAIPLLDSIADEELPCIIISDHLFSSPFPVIINDLEIGYQNVTRYLISMEHNHILFFYNRKNAENQFMLNGMKNYLDTACSDQDIIFETIEYSNHEDILENLKKILFRLSICSVIAFDSFEVLENFLPFFNAIGFDHTNTFSLVGYNLQEKAELFFPPIASVDYNYKQLTDILEKFFEAPSSELSETPAVYHVSPVIRHLSSIHTIIKDARKNTLPAISELTLSRLDKERLLKTKQLYTAAISFHYTGRAYMKCVENGIRNVFQPLNVTLISITDAANDPELQKKQLEGLLAMDTDIIFVYPSDILYLMDTLLKIANSRSKLILMGNYSFDNISLANCSCQIACPENTIACSIAYSMGEYMTNHNLSTAVLLSDSSETFYENTVRCRLIEEILRERYPDIHTHIYETENTDIYNSVLSLIDRYPTVDMMYISWEYPATIALKAIESLERSNIAICTMDLDYEVAVSMASNGPIKLIYGQPLYEYGQALAIAAIHTLLGNKLFPTYVFHTSVINKKSLLESWRMIFKESPPKEILDLFILNY